MPHTLSGEPDPELDTLSDANELKQLELELDLRPKLVSVARFGVPTPESGVSRYSFPALSRVTLQLGGPNCSPDFDNLACS